MKSTFIVPMTGAVVSLLLMTAVGQAQLVRYDLTGLSSSTPPSSAAATTVTTGLTASTLTRGPGIVVAGLGNGFSANNWNNTNSTVSPLSATLANAMQTGDFFQFAVSIDFGYTASFSTLDVSLRRSAIAAPMNYQWQYSFDGFSTPGVGFADFNYFGRSSGTAPATVTPYSWMTADVPGQDAGNPISTLDLSGISAFQNLAGGSTLTFRLFGWGNDPTPGADSNTVALGRFNGPAIGGIVTPVPEPSALSLLAFGFLALFCKRRM
jgi:hypothetical protein